MRNLLSLGGRERETDHLMKRAIKQARNGIFSVSIVNRLLVERMFVESSEGQTFHKLQSEGSKQSEMFTKLKLTVTVRPGD